MIKAFFTEVRGKWITGAADNQLDAVYNLTLTQCAQYCLQNKLCLSFDFINYPELR